MDASGQAPISLPLKKYSCTQWLGAWLDLKAGLDVMGLLHVLLFVLRLHLI
jgi:hypothetical protein